MAPSDEDGELLKARYLLSQIFRIFLLVMHGLSSSDDSCLLVVVLETHEDLWSALADESESPVIGNLSLTTLLQQVRT